MSTAHVDISYDLIQGIYTVLKAKVIYGGITYPVHKSIPKPPPSIYVWITEVLNDEDGTKDAFIYYGTVQVRLINEGQQRADKKKIQGIMNVVRGLLQPSKGSTFSCGSRNLIVFSPGPTNEFTEIADNGIVRMQLIDIYNFIIE